MARPPPVRAIRAGLSAAACPMIPAFAQLACPVILADARKRPTAILARAPIACLAEDLRLCWLLAQPR